MSEHEMNQFLRKWMQTPLSPGQRELVEKSATDDEVRYSPEAIEARKIGLKNWEISGLDFCRDLNACARMEAALSREERARFLVHLKTATVCDLFEMVNADAKTRASALVLALKKEFGTDETDLHTD